MSQLIYFPFYSDNKSNNNNINNYNNNNNNNNRILTAAFQQRRKMMRQSLKGETEVEVRSGGEKRWESGEEEKR